MTVIKVDAATLARVKAGDTPVFLGDESGQPRLRVAVLPLPPEPAEEELAESEADPVTYTLAEVWDSIRGNSDTAT